MAADVWSVIASVNAQKLFQHQDAFIKWHTRLVELVYLFLIHVIVIIERWKGVFYWFSLTKSITTILESMKPFFLADTCCIYINMHVASTLFQFYSWDLMGNLCFWLKVEPSAAMFLLANQVFSAKTWSFPNIKLCFVKKYHPWMSPTLWQEGNSTFT